MMNGQVNLAHGLDIRGFMVDLHPFLAYHCVLLYICRTALLIQRQLVTGEPWLS